MEIHLVKILVVALAALEFPRAHAHDLTSHCVACPDEFKGQLICAFLNGCHLEMEYCSMLVLNCGRYLHRKHMFLVKNMGKCEAVRGYKCKFMDF
ncbi:uncharacterized protein LOC108050942 [Drosophila rhopaloa]|uniref:Uncharacterized protein LOC108050942 n=1 Tax=Drosophila rhopaloa TaxID=1041015 RepID=A0A6P4FEB3_DRORH|nr:uncharacterized protein LOC108050942 [Drosophila rhopaloa]